MTLLTLTVLSTIMLIIIIMVTVIGSYNNRSDGDGVNNSDNIDDTE